MEEYSTLWSSCPRCESQLLPTILAFPCVGDTCKARWLTLYTKFAIILLGFYQVYSGLGLWKNPGPLPHGTTIAWGVLLAFWVVLYLAGFALIPKQVAMRKEALAVGESKSGEEMMGTERRSSVQGLARPSGDV
jgi:hypothetical protein